MKRILLSLIVFALWLTALASERADSIVSAGNRAYLLGQRSTILDCARALDAMLARGEIDRSDSLSYGASMLKLYGNYHYENGALDSTSFALAEDYYNRAEALKAQRLSTGHLIDLEKAQLYYRLERYGEALAAVDRAYNYVDSTGIYEPGDAEWNDIAMQRAMCLARTGKAAEAVAIADATLPDYADRHSLDYAKALRMKAKILTLAARRPSEALKAYKDFFKLQKEYAKANFATMDASAREQYWLNLRPFVADCYRLEGLDAGFLYDVTLFSKSLLLHLSLNSGGSVASENALRSLDANHADISQALPPRSAAIEYVEYEKDGTRRLCALVLRPGRPVSFVAMSAPDTISALGGSALAGTDRKDKDGLYGNTAFQNALWPAELLSAIKGCDRVYFAPDGILHRIALEYMPQADGRDMYRLTSTRRLLEPVRQTSATDGTLLAGRIDYGYCRDTNTSASVPNDTTAFQLYRGYSFARLSAESDETAIIHSSRGNSADSLLTGARAGEAAFREVVPGYSSVILSTHGHFDASATPAGTDLKPTLTEEALSESIVAFAGVNAALRRGRAQSDRCDGILSARELATLDLSRCNLFVLSACQTALGRISADGVFGLQRGLKSAGAGAMLVSLWSVNSDATSRLMQDFYANLGKGMGVHKAYNKARLDMATREPEQETSETIFNPATMSAQTVTHQAPDYSTPQFTHAFILIDAID